VKKPREDVAEEDEKAEDENGYCGIQWLHNKTVGKVITGLFRMEWESR
jgi:hypothetical protein